MKGKSLSRVQLLETPWTAAHQSPPPMGFSRQEYWSGVPLPSPSIDRGMDKEDVVHIYNGIFSSVQSLSCVRLFATLWTAACQASLSSTISWSLLRLMSIESVMPSNYLILYRPLLLLPSVFSSIRVFSNESALHIRWPKYWSFSFSINPSSEYSELIFF